ncbi:MAG: 50S ribosomal protein L32 [Solirubrobacterales bacterium]
MAGSPLVAEPLYHLATPMAVPKKKQSRSRTNKRRSQHKISAPSYNECPQCHAARLPHRVCPQCGHYAGREVVKPGPSPEEPQSPQSP